MLASLACCLVLSGPATPVSALHSPVATVQQSRSELRKEFKERLSKVSSNDTSAMFALVLWAERKGLTSDSLRLCRKIIKIDENHEGARKKLGYIEHEGKWVKKRELAAILKKKKEKEYKAKGWVKHDGIWIDPKDLRFAKLGLLKRNGQWVRRIDAKYIDEGRAQHPRIGLWMPKKDLEKADSDLFPVGGKWLDLEKANQAHKSWESPWVIVQDDFVLYTTEDLDEAEKQIVEISSALRSLKPVLWESRLPLPLRFNILLCTDKNQYQQFGAGMDDTGYSSYGAFYAPKVRFRPIVVNYAEQGWNAYYLRHAVGLGLSNVLFERAGLPPTSWLHTGIAAYLERWQNRGNAQHFGKQFIAKGGVMNMAKFFTSFAVNPKITTDEMNRNIYQAGIIFSFLFDGGKEAAGLQKAFDKLKQLVFLDKPNARKATRALKAFEKEAAKAEEQIKSHLQKLLAG